MSRGKPEARRGKPAALTRTVVAAALALAASVQFAPAQAYEADVHYGLTQWLALKAGFDESQSEAIAVGNHRVDSGRMDTMELNLEHACVGRFAEAAQDVQKRHYPSATPAPSAPDRRVVEPNSAASRKPMTELLARAKGKEGLLLSQFGATLHTLQDSWSHAGTPGVASPGGGLACEATLASGHPAARGGADSHDADLTHRYPGEVLPMAQATYEALVAYPPVQGRARKAAAWSDLAAEVERFARARTKTEKREWFVAQGVAVTDFLEGVSLPDGPSPGSLQFGGRKLPPLKGPKSTQHDAPADVKAFFDGLIARWLGSEPVEDVVAELAGAKKPEQAPAAKAAVKQVAKRAAAKPDPKLRELTARMKLWKLRDHGSASPLAHAAGPLNAKQLAAVDRLAKQPSAYVAPASVAAAFFPLLAKGEHASPLLPYIVRELPASGANPPRMIAIARLMHAPYDTIGWIAERAPSGWVLVDVVAAVDQ